MENKDKALIRKYIHQSCTPEELEEMKRLMQLPGTQDLFDEVLAESWTGLKANNDIDQPHLNAQLKKFYQNIELKERAALQHQEVEQSVTRRLKFRQYMPYAAVFALVVFGLVIYNALQLKKTPVKEQFAMRTTVNPNGQRSKIILPDSSEVFLAAGSKLSFPDHFAAGKREVSLEGEAFFQVTKNPRRPFIIHTGSVQTKVLGTSFKIEAFKHRAMVVAVATGKVRVDEYNGKEPRSLAVLTPGQMVTYNHENAVTAKVDIEELKSWKDAMLSFHNESMQKITTELERWYNVKISYSRPAKAKEKISVVLKVDMPLNKIMKVLAATGHFKYQINTQNITIN